MNQNPQADSIEWHLEENRQVAQALAESVEKCCQAAEKHPNPHSKRNEDKDAGDSN